VYCSVNKLHPNPIPTPTFELGRDHLQRVTVDADGRLLPQAQVIRDGLAQAECTDSPGVNVARRSTRLRLLCAGTELGSDEPSRVFQRSSTVDAASNGRAAVIRERGSFTESLPRSGSDSTTTRHWSRNSASCTRQCSRTMGRANQCRGRERRARRSRGSECCCRR